MFSWVATYSTKLLSEKVCMSCFFMRVKQKTSKDLTLTKFWHSHTVGFSEDERNCLLISLFMRYVQQVTLSQHQTTRQNSFLIKILGENYLRAIKMLVSATISSGRNVEVTGNVAMCFFLKYFLFLFSICIMKRQKCKCGWLIVLFILKLSAVYSWESPFFYFFFWESPFMGRILFLSW